MFGHQACFLWLAWQPESHYKQWCSGKYLFGGTHGEREPITGVWGQSPQRGPGAEPLVGGQGGLCPPEAEKVLSFGHAMETANLPYNSLYFGN